MQCDKALALRFLNYWFPRLDNFPDQRICIWTKAPGDAPPNWRFFVSTEDAANFAAEVSPSSNVYFGTCTINQIPDTGRGTALHTGGLWGLWLDVDVAHDGVHKKEGLPASYEEAMELIEAMGLDPSIVVHSGHGLQAYWPLEKPILFERRDPDCPNRRQAAALSYAWNQTLIYCAKRRGLRVDSVYDLARVMRLPGTHNRKAEPVKPVVLAVPSIPLTEDRLRRFSIEDIDLVIVPAALAGGMPDGGGAGGLIPAESCEAVIPDRAKDRQPDWIAEVCEISTRFKATWERRKTRDQEGWTDTSASSWDMSLTSQLVALGAQDQQIADALFWFRKRHGEDTGKLFRRDAPHSRAYLMRTIAKARTEHSAKAALDAVTSETGAGHESAMAAYQNAVTPHLNAKPDADPHAAPGLVVPAVDHDDYDKSAGDDLADHDNHDKSSGNGPDGPPQGGGSAPRSPMSDKAKTETLALISKGFGINITKITKQNRENSVYNFTLSDGAEIYIGGIQDLMNQDHVRGVLANATSIMIRIVKKPQWHRAVQIMLNCADYIENSESERKAQIAEYLRSYLLCMRPACTEWGDEESDVWRYFERKDPFIDKGRLYITASSLIAHIHGTTAERIDSKRIWDLLRIAGFTSSDITKRGPSGIRACRTMWAANLGDVADILPTKDDPSEFAQVVEIEKR